MFDFLVVILLVVITICSVVAVVNSFCRPSMAYYESLSNRVDVIRGDIVGMSKRISDLIDQVKCDQDIETLLANERRRINDARETLSNLLYDLQPRG